MKEKTVQIDGMMSIFDGAGVEKQIKRRDGVVRVDANFLSGTATIVYDETRVAPDDIKTFIAECGYHCRGEVVPEHVCEPGKPNGTPTVRAMEHQGHAVPPSPTPSAVKSVEEKIKAEAPPTPPVVKPPEEKVKPETQPPGSGAKAEHHAGHGAEEVARDKAEMADVRSRVGASSNQRSSMRASPSNTSDCPLKRLPIIFESAGNSTIDFVENIMNVEAQSTQLSALAAQNKRKRLCANWRQQRASRTSR